MERFLNFTEREKWNRLLNDHAEHVIVLEQDEILKFCGRNDSQLRDIERRSDTRIIARGNELRISGDSANVRRTAGMIEDLLELHRKTGQKERREMDRQKLHAAMSQLEAKGEASIKEALKDQILVPARNKVLTPLTPGQKEYVDAIRRYDIVFGIGPAGTGKTYLACAMAVSALTQQKVRRIILARPAVEAGERLGFLPGDLEAKINPYLRPLYDALYEMMEAERVRECIESGVIEVAPLAFMRGRTLNSAFVILDEAQNTSGEQMKMFLTRLGFDSRAVITGDVTQIDLEHKRDSGLVQVQEILAGIDEIHFQYFNERDVVRHELVQKIIKAYDRNDIIREKMKQAEAEANQRPVQ
ncbi:PhoH family protein [Candidatus Sumerlaeota bacterium]|nr:PhoH family protein [Candidatus Sumerlaeota bacterium]